MIGTPHHPRTGLWQTYLSAQGWVVLDENNEVLLNTGSDDTGPEAAEVVRRHNELVSQLEAELATCRGIVTDLAHVNPRHHTAIETLRKRARMATSTHESEVPA